MNYRHAYHAGNFADVLKHAALALVIAHLKRKPAAFRIIDTHAGSGRYALGSVEASKTAEWQGGIGRLLGAGAAPLPAPIAALMASYLDAVRVENDGKGLTVYPGSPQIARHLMRPGDALVANELHPEEHAKLKAAVGRDRRVKVLALDGWLALKAQLPPKGGAGSCSSTHPLRRRTSSGAWPKASQKACTGLRPGCISPGTRSRTPSPSRASIAP
jgi:23S rRNA (adenine2030-N6)-methyltransferase